MTRKHFTAIAQALADYHNTAAIIPNENTKAGARGACNCIARSLAYTFEDVNPRFNRTAFLNAYRKACQ